MSSKYQFVAVSAAGWCLEGMQEISGGNLYSHSILNGCWWPWFRVGVKLQKQYFIYLPGKERLSEQGVKLSQLDVEQRESHKSLALSLIHI